LRTNLKFKAVCRKLTYWCFLVFPFLLCQGSAIAQTGKDQNIFNASERLGYVSGIDLDVRTRELLINVKETNSAKLIANINPLIVGTGKAIKVYAYEINGNQETFLSSMELSFNRKKHNQNPIKFDVALGRFEKNQKDVLFRFTDSNLNVASEMKATFYADNLDAQPQISENSNQCDPLDVNCFVRNTLSELNPKVGKYSSVQENPSGGFDIIFALPKGSKKSSIKGLDFSTVDDGTPNTNAGSSDGSSNNVVRANSVLVSDAEGKPYWKDQDSFLKANNATIGQGNNNEQLKNQIQGLAAVITALQAQVNDLRSQLNAHANNEAIHVDPTAPTTP
jgi:hypothetical protein